MSSAAGAHRSYPAVGRDPEAGVALVSALRRVDVHPVLVPSCSGWQDSCWPAAGPTPQPTSRSSPTRVAP